MGRRKHSKPRQKLTFSRLLLTVLRCGVALAAVCVLGGYGLYLYSDHLVEVWLLGTKPSVEPGIYSDVVKVSQPGLLSQSMLEDLLARRNYSSIQETPSLAGQYRATPNSLEIYTRAFLDGELRQYPAIPLTITFNEHGVEKIHGIPEGAELLMEPELLHPFSSSSQRSSSFRRLDEIPRNLIVAVIAIEDERFTKHPGVDIFGILRATLTNMRAGRLVQGGSTITQQLAKNTILSPQKTIKRKVLEIFAAISLEQRLSKQQILEAYLNEVYLGQEGAVAIHGVAAATRAFFGHDIDTLSLPEAALLAGIIQAPSYHSPKRHPQRAWARAQTVLEKMRELGAIEAAEFNAAKKTRPAIQPGQAYAHSGSYLPAALQRELEGSIDFKAAEAGGASVITAINPGLQRCGEMVLPTALAELNTRYPVFKKSREPIQAGIVAIAPDTGKIVTWVGGADYSSNQFDHVDQAKRQVGSTIKPFLYLTAMDPALNQYRVGTAISLISDEPINIDQGILGEWQPENFDREFRGDVTFRYALEQSLNIPAVYVGQRVGIPTLARTLQLFRVGQDLPRVPALALGAIDTTLLRLTSAYAALASGGVYVRPRLFLSVIDNQGAPLISNDLYAERIVAEAPTFIVTDMMRGVIERGTGAVVRRLGYTEPAAGKTGTSSDARDAWFVGFTSDLVAGVWVGFDDNHKIGLAGGQIAAPIWTQFMQCARPFHTPRNFTPPPGVVSLQVDTASGTLATEACPTETVVTEIFLEGTEPRRPCPLHLPYNTLETAKENEHSKPSAHRRRGFWDVIFGND